MIGREASEPKNGIIEAQARTEVERRVQKRSAACNYTFSNCDSVQRRPWINAKPDSRVYSIPSLQAPRRKLESFLESFRSFSRSAHKKNPQRPNACLLDALGDLAY